MNKEVKKQPFEYKGVKFNILTMEDWHTASLAPEVTGVGIFITGLPATLTKEEAVIFLKGYEEGFKAAKNRAARSMDTNPINEARKIQHQSEGEKEPGKKRPASAWI